MTTLRTTETGEVRKLVKWATRKRKGKSRKWKSKWVVVKQAGKDAAKPA